MKAEGRSYKRGRFRAENVLEKKCGKAQGRVGLTRRRRGGVKRTIKERSVSPILTNVATEWVNHACYCADVDFKTVSTASFSCDKCTTGM